jgi:hypothetical protein|tara:strand:+ start:944 stop:2104 length:1161 start_codon:yes stop_codon:yes gene_type:complete
VSYRVGIVSPGFIGQQLAYGLIQNGHEVVYASEGRSESTIENARNLGMKDAGSMFGLCRVVDIIISVVNHDSILEVVDDVVENGFKGLFVDFNWLRGEDWELCKDKITKAGMKYIDSAVYAIKGSKFKYVLIEGGYTGTENSKYEKVLLKLFPDGMTTLSDWSPKIIDMNPKDYKNMKEGREGSVKKPIGDDNQHTVGILSPGRMGATIGLALKNCSHDVLWASQGKFIHEDSLETGYHSPETRLRAEDIFLEDAETIENLVDECHVIVSVTSGEAVHRNAALISECGFDGIYVDANGINCDVGDNFNTDLLEIVNNDVMKYVEAGIHGYPADRTGERLLFLNGEYAQSVADLFGDDIFKVVVLEESSKEYKNKKDEERNENSNTP